MRGFWLPAATASPPARRRTRWLVVPAAVAVVCCITFALTTPEALAGFIASITNTGDSAATGVLTINVSNSDGTVSCSSAAVSVTSNTASCSTINIYAGSNTMLPGDTFTNTITLTNTGTVTANTVTASFGACSQSAGSGAYGSATDLCSQLLVTVQANQGGTVTTLTSAGSSPASVYGHPATLSPLAAGATDTLTYSLTMPSTLSTNYENLSIAQSVVFSFGS